MILRIDFKGRKGIEFIYMNNSEGGLIMKGRRLAAFLLAFIMAFSSIGIVDVHAAEVTEKEAAKRQSTDITYFYQERMNDRAMLPHWSDGFSNTLRYELTNSEFPYGTEGYVSIKNVELEILEGSEDAFWLQPFEDGTGWSYGANSFGHAILTLTHESAVGGEDITREFHLWCGTDVWDMPVFYDTATDRVLPGNELTVVADVRHHCYSEEEGHFEGDANVELEWGFQESDSLEYNGLVIEPQWNICHVRADENAQPGQGAEIWVKAYLLNEDGSRQQENGEDIEVVRHHFYIHVESDYYVTENIPENIGADRCGSFIFNPVLKCYSMEEGVNDITEDMRFVWGWDNNALENIEGLSFDTEDNVWYSYADSEVTFQLFEHCDWTNGVEVTAQLKDEDGNYFDVHRTYCNVNLYDVELRYPNRGHIYENEVLALRLIPRNLEYADGAELEVNVGVWQQDVFVPFEDQIDLYDLDYSYRDGMLTLNGPAIAEFREKLDADSRFYIKIDAVEDETEIFSRSFEFFLAEPQVEYRYGDAWAHDQSMLICWENQIGKEISYHVENEEHPNGHDGTVEIVSAKIQQLEGDAGAFWLRENEDGTGWVYGTNGYGVAKITIAHYGVDGQMVEHSFKVYAGEEVWDLSLDSGSTNGWMLPGETLNINAGLWKETYTKEAGYSFKDMQEAVRYEWGYCGENRDDLFDITFDAKNPSVLKVKARENKNLEQDEGTEIWIRAYETTEYGEYEVAYNSVWIGVSNIVNEVKVDGFDSSYNVGDTFTINPTLLFRSKETPRGEVCTDDTLNFRYEYNHGITMESMDGVAATFTRDGDWRSEIHVIACLSDEYGEYEAARCRLVLDRKDYEIFFEGTRGENHTWVFQDEEAHEICLNTSKIANIDANELEYVWEVGRFDENGSHVPSEEACTILETEGKVVLNGVKLAEEGFGEGLDVTVRVYHHDRLLAERSVWVWVEGTAFELYNCGFDTLAGKLSGWCYPNKRILGYVKDANYPNGKEIEFDIENIEVVSVEGQEDVFKAFTEIDSQWGEWWRITADSIGQQEVVYVLRDPENPAIRYEKTYQLSSGKEIYVVVVDENIGSMTMIPEESRKLQISVYQKTVDENDDMNIVTTLVPQDRYRLSFGYDDNMLKVSKYGKVTAKTGEGQTGLGVYAEVTMLDGESTYFCGQEIGVNIVPSRTAMRAEVLYVEPGELINIKDLSVELYKETYQDDGTTVATYYEPKNMKFTAADDEDIFQIAWLGKKMAVNDEITPYEGENFPIDRWVHIRATRAGVEYTCAVQVKICDKHHYEDIVKPATMTADGSVSRICSKCGHEISKQTIYKVSDINLSADSYVYNGSSKKPSVTLKDSNGKGISSDYYTVTYGAGRKNVGKYSVKVSLKGNYEGTKTIYFIIEPKATTISSVTAGAKAFTVKWKKVNTQTTGYEIEYSTSSKFKNAKSITIKGSSTTSKKISGLSAKKKYYVRVRTYKTVNGTKYYSSWSSVKKITTK